MTVNQVEIAAIDPDFDRGYCLYPWWNSLTGSSINFTHLKVPWTPRVLPVTVYNLSRHHVMIAWAIGASLPTSGHGTVNPPLPC